ncbi:hypothetical protein DL764_005851 [Monosporascus ibericus]|uniref:Uncharacterized protein n=1 Tax=Monosporascus ibericus TaxID=155417 RepID=A0A4Q4T747_9PEZI|nr:hypothetical protein DL764_005851 [Monosporascus ibericus]
MAPHASDSRRPTPNGSNLYAATTQTVQTTNSHVVSDGHIMPIAIVGMSCRFPGGATNPSKLWDMLCGAKSAWSPIPKERFNAEAYFHPDPERNGAINVEGGHFLKEDIGRFDASFFNISPNEAKAIDPQQRLQLESAYEALENAGIPLEKVAGSNTSVYVGVFGKDYGEMLSRDPENAPVYAATGNGFAILSNRISYFFDLKGPSVTLDTACSASLTALHLACQSLRTGESKMAIVGGTNIIHSADMMVCMSLLRFFSQEGRCYSFDHRACGYSRGEGVATVILKPLDAALRDGDPFEAHGTGTAAGDPLEAGAIATVLVAVYKCDVGDAASLDAAMTQCRAEMPPVRGVIHGGMVLRDSIFQNMTHSDWQTALKPKVAGTINLCRSFSASASALDFLILLSSSAGMVGNFGQGNYSASSTFQDAVAHHYAFGTAQNATLPIVTIDLGMILGAGYVTENEDAEQNLRKWGYLGIEHEKFLSIIKSAMMEARRPASFSTVSQLIKSMNKDPLLLRCQVATGLGTRGMVDSAVAGAAPGEQYQMPFWFYDVRFSHLLQLDRLAARQNGGDGNGADGGAAFKNVDSFAAAQLVLCDFLLEKLSKVLMIPLAELNSALPMSAYGVDSLVAVEIRNWIFREMKVDMPVFELQGGASLMELCETIAKRSPLVSEELRAQLT